MEKDPILTRTAEPPPPRRIIPARVRWFRRMRRLLRRYGYEISEYPPVDWSEADWELVRKVKPYTMTTHARIHSLIEAVRHVTREKIPGAITECGVWRGGSMMAAALTLIAEGDTRREFFLYDTYEGMPEPGEKDRNFRGESAKSRFEQYQSQGEGWCLADLNDVRRNLTSTGYPMDRIHFVEGKVEETIPATMPDSISILRLDTDWYSSTRHELVNLYPRLVPGGILIIDDFGHWDGSRKATEEYFATVPAPLLCRIDYAARIGVKAR